MSRIDTSLVRIEERNQLETACVSKRIEQQNLEYFIALFIYHFRLSTRTIFPTTWHCLSVNGTAEIKRRKLMSSIIFVIILSLDIYIRQ